MTSQGLIAELRVEPSHGTVGQGDEAPVGRFIDDEGDEQHGNDQRGESRVGRGVTNIDRTQMLECG